MENSIKVVFKTSAKKFFQVTKVEISSRFKFFRYQGPTFSSRKNIQKRLLNIFNVKVPFQVKLHPDKLLQCNGHP